MGITEPQSDNTPRLKPVTRQRVSGLTLTKALAEVCLLVYEYFGTNNGAKRHEGLQQVHVCELLRQVVYEQIGAIRALRLLAGGRIGGQRCLR